MSRQRLTRVAVHMGWIAGITAFLLFGLLQGALVGGTVGIETGSYLFGYDASVGGMSSRLMAAAGMVAGVAITGAMFITCGLALGRLTAMFIGSGAGASRDAELPEQLYTKRN